MIQAAPSGWQGKVVYPEETAYVHLWWEAKDIGSALPPGGSTGGFVVGVAGPSAVQPGLRGLDGGLVRPIDFGTLPFTVGGTGAQCWWGRVRPAAGPHGGADALRASLAAALGGQEKTMSVLEHGSFRSVKVDDLPWRPSTMAPGVFVRDIAVTDGWEMQIVRFEPGARFPAHTHESPEFLFILEGELVRAGRRMGPGWASVASSGTIDEDVYSETGCVFVLVDRA